MAFERLKKQLNLFDVFALSIGPMLSSGIFLLPGLVFREIGPMATVAYLIAGLLIFPALFSKAELATAMPRAGGTYYFLHRSMGAAIGTIAGLGTWLALIFKSAFDLIGLGAYLVIFYDLPIKPLAIALSVLFMVLSIAGVKKVGKFQGILVGLLIAILFYFIAMGIPWIDTEAIELTLPEDGRSFLASIGLVYVGFTGITKVASVAEEVDNMDRNIPLGMLISMIATMVLYILTLTVMIGVSPAAELSQSLTPITDAADHFLGTPGVMLMTLAAVIAFTASANAGLTAASRYPLAMSRDKIAPDFLKKLGNRGTPTYSIAITSGLMIVFILLLSPTGIAKLASAFQLLLFGLINLAVIVMRESGIESYDPEFRSPWYPWLQIIGVLTTVILIPELGFLPVLFSSLLIGISILWYMFYVQKQKKTQLVGGAMLHMFQKMGESADAEVDKELRGILKEKGLKDQSVFNESLSRADVLHHQEGEDIDQVLWRASEKLSNRLPATAKHIHDAVISTSRIGDTPIGQHIALPHARIEAAEQQEVVIIHSSYGIEIDGSDELIYVVFVLISPQDAPRKHLRFLAELANRAESVKFSESWKQITEAREIKRLFGVDDE